MEEVSTMPFQFELRRDTPITNDAEITAWEGEGGAVAPVALERPETLMNGSSGPSSMDGDHRSSGQSGVRHRSRIAPLGCPQMTDKPRSVHDQVCNFHRYLPVRFGLPRR